MAARRDFSAPLFQRNELLLAIPLILSFSLLSGMRIVFTIPTTLICIASGRPQAYGNSSGWSSEEFFRSLLR